jgi:hypothetical protein
MRSFLNSEFLSYHLWRLTSKSFSYFPAFPVPSSMVLKKAMTRRQSEKNRNNTKRLSNNSSIDFPLLGKEVCLIRHSRAREVKKMDVSKRSILFLFELVVAGIRYCRPLFILGLYMCRRLWQQSVSSKWRRYCSIWNQIIYFTPLVHHTMLNILDQSPVFFIILRPQKKLQELDILISVSVVGWGVLRSDVFRDAVLEQSSWFHRNVRTSQDKHWSHVLYYVKSKLRNVWEIHSSQ